MGDDRAATYEQLMALRQARIERDIPYAVGMRMRLDLTRDDAEELLEMMPTYPLKKREPRPQLRFEYKLSGSGQSWWDKYMAEIGERARARDIETEQSINHAAQIEWVVNDDSRW